MKTFLWLSTIALSVVCLFSWALSSLVMHSLSDTYRDLLPAITVFVLQPNWWIPFYPLPWVVAAGFLSAKKELSINAVLRFAGSLVLGATLFICAVVLAGVLPYIALKVSLGK